MPPNPSPSHLAPRDVAPFVAEMEVCQLTSWVKGMTPSLVLQWALCPLVGVRCLLQNSVLRAQTGKRGLGWA